LIELFLIYAVNNISQRWIEEVCNSNEEAEEKIQYLKNLKNRAYNLPKADDKLWDNLGLTFTQRRYITDKLKECRDEIENDDIYYYIENDYIQEDFKDQQTDTEFVILEVSPKNSMKNYIHTIQALDAFSTPTEIYKISLSNKLTEGTSIMLPLEEFIVKDRPAGFIYRSTNGYNKITKVEKWLFIKTDEDE
jgi:hypothetical protein